MPSPFPGMDPYLEGSEWMSIHFELASTIIGQLQPKLSPSYLARPARRFVMDVLEDVTITRRDAYPDVNVVRVADDHSAFGSVAVTAAPLELVTIMTSPIPHITIEIRDVANRDLVTAIEVLSPTNKRGDGYKEYQEKRQDILVSTAHLVELDLLRMGQRVPMYDPLPSASYFIFVSRAERRPIVQVWPIEMHMPLPSIPVPLLNETQVMLDVQQALDTAYDTLRMDLSVNYTRPPDVPLEGAAAAWVEERLRARGHLPTAGTQN